MMLMVLRLYWKPVGQVRAPRPRCLFSCATYVSPHTCCEVRSRCPTAVRNGVPGVDGCEELLPDFCRELFLGVITAASLGSGIAVHSSQSVFFALLILILVL